MNIHLRQWHADDAQNIFELPEEHGKYTNKYIGIFMLDQEQQFI